MNRARLITVVVISLVVLGLGSYLIRDRIYRDRDFPRVGPQKPPKPPPGPEAPATAEEACFPKKFSCGGCGANNGMQYPRDPHVTEAHGTPEYFCCPEGYLSKLQNGEVVCAKNEPPPP
jgi:hypothetical protein